MTMTMEETTTTQTLTEQREAARSRMTDPPAIPGRTFAIPAGYRVVNDTNYRAPNSGHNSFLVTGIDDRDSLSPDSITAITAGIVGAAIHDVRASSGGNMWYSPSHQGIPSAYVTGAWLRTGALGVQDEDVLVCFADGSIGRWYAEHGRRPAGHSLEMIHGPFGTTPAAPSGMDFMGRNWVPVKEDSADSEPEPFSAIPAGWKIAPTPVPQDGPAGSTRSLLVMSTGPAFNDSGAKYAGTIQQGRPNGTRDAWIFNGEFGGYYAEAALINPRIEEGKFYWVDKQQQLAHADHNRILWRAEHPNGIISGDDMDPWIEVVRDGAETSLQPEAAAEPAVCPYPNECTRESPTLGLAASTNPELDPKPVAGAEYVAWGRDWTPGGWSMLVRAATRADGDLVFTRAGMFRAVSGEVTYSRDTDSLALTLASLQESFHWVKAVLTPADIPAGEAAPDLSASVATVHQRRELYSDALNELAESHSWCSEFESVVQTMGFPGRTEMAKDYAVALSVTFSMEDDGPSSNMDRRVESHVFSDNVSSLSLTQMTFSGTLDFTMSVSGVKPRTGDDSLDSRIMDALNGHINDSMVESALGDMLPGSFNVSNWTVESYDEDN